MMKAACRILAGVLVAAALSWPANLVIYPYLQNMQSDRVTVMWATTTSGSGVVQYSPDRSFSRSVLASIREFLSSETGLGLPFYQHQAEITGLAAGAEYFYRVLVDGQILTLGDELRFRTAGPGPFNFLAFGDSGAGTLEQAQLATRMSLERPALVVHTGDLAYMNGTFGEFQARHFGYYWELMKRTPFFPTPGNHEYYTNNAAPYLALHSLPAANVPAGERGRYYSFDWGNAHFVSLDTNAPLAEAVKGTGAMLEWLENDLRNTRQFWRVVYFHHAPYAAGPNAGDPILPTVRERVAPILDRHDVQLVLNGHEHSYQRSLPIRNGVSVEAGLGTVYITTGGGGASLYPVSSHPLVIAAQSVHHYVRGEVQGPQITLRAIAIDGREIDRITLSPVPAISADSAVNAASFTAPVAPGALVSIFGRNLAAEEIQARQLPLPTELAGTTVTINGRRLPLLYVSRSQVNAQLPFDVGGTARLQVATPNGFSEAAVAIAETGPGIFSVGTQAGPAPTIVHADGRLVTAASPARTGEHISVYLTGLGDVNGQISAGQPAPLSPLLTVRAPVDVEIGGELVMSLFAGLAPGFAGLYQVNLEVPQELASGAYSFRIVAKGRSSNTVRVSVRAAP